MAVNKPIQFKRSAVASKVPLPADLQVGELALNTTDKVIYTKDAAGKIVRLAPDVIAPVALTYAKTDVHTLSVSGTAETGTIGTIADKKAVIYATAPVNADVGKNYADAKSRVLQDVIMVDTNPAITTRDVSDSIRALAVYGIGVSDKKENTAYITEAGSIYSGNSITIGKSKTFGTQHVNGPALSINMSKEKPQSGAINIEAFSDTNTSRVISINEGFTITAGQLITSGTAPISSGMDAKDPNAPKYANTWNLYETPQEFVKMYSHVENACIYGVTATGEVYYTGSVVSGEAGVGVANGYVNVWTKAAVEGVEELFISYGTAFARTFDGKWYVSGRAQATVLGAEGSNTPTNTFKQIFSLPANARSIYYGYGGNGSDYAFLTTADGTLYVRGYNNNGHLLTGNMSQSYANWTVHPNAIFKNPRGIYTTSNSTYLVTASGDLYVGGYVGNSYYLGANPDTSSSYIVNPAKIPFTSPVKQLLPGYVTGRVVLENGDLMGCGDGGYGFHGISNGTVRLWTKAMEGVDRIYGHRFLLAVKTDGTRWFVGNQALVGDKKSGEIRTWVQASTIPSSPEYVMTQTVMYARGGVSSRAVHASTAVSGGATIKVSIPSPTDMTGSAKMWNTMMFHNGGQAAPILRVDGLGNVETTGSYYVNGKEVYHPGNMPVGTDSRALTNNYFDLQDGTNPIVFARSEVTKTKDNLSFVVEDALTRITHNNDDTSSAMVFTLNNTDMKVNGGVAKNKHEMIFSGGLTDPTLTINGKKVYHEGNFTATNTGDFLSKVDGGTVLKPVGFGEMVNNYPVSIVGYQDTTKEPSGLLCIKNTNKTATTRYDLALLRIETDAGFSTRQQMISVINSGSPKFLVESDGTMFANEVRGFIVNVNHRSSSGGASMGSDITDPNDTRFYIRPTTQSPSGDPVIRQDRQLAFRTSSEEWFTAEKFSTKGLLTVGTMFQDRPKCLNHSDYQVTVKPINNGVLVQTLNPGTAPLTLQYVGTSGTQEMLRVIAKAADSPSLNAIGIYPAPDVGQGSPSFAVGMNGDLISKGTGNFVDVYSDVKSKLYVQNTDKTKDWAATFFNHKKFDPRGTQGNCLQLGATAGGNLISGLAYTGEDLNQPDEVFSVNYGGAIVAKGGMTTNGLAYFGWTYPNGFMGTKGTGSGLSIQGETITTDKVRFSIGADKLIFDGMPNTLAPGSYDPYQLLIINRLNQNVEIPAGSIVSPNSIVHNIVGASGGWARGTVLKNRTPANDTESWSQNIKASYGFYGTGSTIDSFYVGFTADSWNTPSMKVLPDGTVQSKNGVFGTVSDERLKSEISPTAPKLDDLLKVNVVNYKLKADASGTKMLGVVAQELEQIFPGLVRTEADGIKSVKYSIFTPMLVKGIQELHARKVQQDEKIAVLEHELEELRYLRTLIPKLIQDVEDLKNRK